MKSIFKNRAFKVIIGVIAFLLLGAFIAAANGHGETAQSGIVGTIFTPCHYVATKISNGLDKAFGELKGDQAYKEEIIGLKEQIGDLQSQLVDYENLKNQNELYKEFLELKEDNKDYSFVEASVVARDSADIYKSFTISKGAISGVKAGDAVLQGKYLVGVIDKVYPDYSVVQSVLDPDFNISAYEIVTNEISYVTGTANLAKQGKCKMANLDSSTEIAYGSIICTAGISGTVPKGLIIGTVEEINEEDTDISSYAVITPGVDIEDVSSCFVLINYGDKK